MKDGFTGQTSGERISWWRKQHVQMRGGLRSMVRGKKCRIVKGKEAWED